ncbi:MAG: ParB N-terminal domain-containing protein [Planctomycetes bacterium]|nr:ParB N-terminal domain-containing protein [Planctomycetota bacterium]
MAKTTARKPGGRRKKPPEPVGLIPPDAAAKAPREVEDLCAAIDEDGGKALSAYRDPLGGRWLVLAVLPIEQVEPTPYQRGLSDAHVKRLTDVIGRTGRFLDPVIATRVEPRKYQTPNGHHRASAMKALGARSITALVVTEPEVARLILALNVEKAHNLREKSLEAVRLARHLAELPPAKESDYSLEFEEAAFLTLGMCYEGRPRFAGGAYHPLLRRCDAFLEKPLAKALEEREEHVKVLGEIDDLVASHVEALKAKGLESPYLKTFVVARLNPLRFRRGATLPLGEALEQMLKAARKFDPGKVSVADLARSGGAPEADPAPE